jgi:hypothetical protein
VPVTLRRQFPPVGRGSVAARLRGALASSIGFAYSHLTSPRTAEIPVTVLSLGDVLIAGMPADFGVGATLELRRRLEALAPGPSLVASHTNSYAGYVHLEHEYVRCPRCRDDMFLYENAMGWYGPQVGSVLLDAAVSAATRARSA